MLSSSVRREWVASFPPPFGRGGALRCARAFAEACAHSRTSAITLSAPMSSAHARSRLASALGVKAYAREPIARAERNGNPDTHEARRSPLTEPLTFSPRSDVLGLTLDYSPTRMERSGGDIWSRRSIPPCPAIRFTGREPVRGIAR